MCEPINHIAPNNHSHCFFEWPESLYLHHHHHDFALGSSSPLNSTREERKSHSPSSLHGHLFISIIPSSLAVFRPDRMVAGVLLLGRLLVILLLAFSSAAVGIRLGGSIHRHRPVSQLPVFREAPAFRNSDEFCSGNFSTIHVAMTLDGNYLRGTIAAVLSILQHATCPENLSFHFLSSTGAAELHGSLRATFPYLSFAIYRFNASRLRSKISKSIRQALDQPLNYVRIHLADILPPEVTRVIYLDSDLVVVDDIAKLWGVHMEPDDVVAAPEYCHANFTQYFTDAFWSDPSLADTFQGRTPCYFNTGVMVVDVGAWRRGGYTERVEEWMALQKRKRIYQLGSLPPFLLVFAGKIRAVDHRWNQHGLGGDNFEGKCRTLHPGPVSLLHWSGKGKPWLRLDSRRPCSVDHLWAPYDLYRSSRHSLEG